MGTRAHARRNSARSQQETNTIRNSAGLVRFRAAATGWRNPSRSSEGSGIPPRTICQYSFGVCARCVALRRMRFRGRNHDVSRAARPRLKSVSRARLYSTNLPSQAILRMLLQEARRFAFVVMDRRRIHIFLPALASLFKIARVSVLRRLI